MKIFRKAIVPIIALLVILALLPGCAQAINITSASVNSSGHLIVSLSNGQTLDAGYVIGPVGATGPIGPTGPAGPAGQAISVTSTSVNIPRIATIEFKVHLTVRIIEAGANLSLL